MTVQAVSKAGFSALAMPRWRDALLLAAEWSARQVYWRAPRLRAWAVRRRAHRPRRAQVADRDALKKRLREIGVTDGALVMAHTSTSNVRLNDPSGPSDAPAAALNTAKQLLADLFALVGDSGTLVMPTHAVYQSAREGTLGPERFASVVYDPARTPCGVGLVNELFWRSPGVQRSLHPFNTLAARGPLASELLHDNLSDSKPLPHGVDSGYYRVCRHNGLVVSVGVPLERCITLLHVAEDVRDRDWPVPDFFEERRYIVRADGREREWTVRQRQPVYGMFCLCLRKFGRDLRRAGLLHEGSVGGVRVDWVRSREVFDFLMERNRTTPYPYYGTRLVRPRS